MSHVDVDKKHIEVYVYISSQHNPMGVKCSAGNKNRSLCTLILSGSNMFAPTYAKNVNWVIRGRNEVCDIVGKSLSEVMVYKSMIVSILQTFEDLLPPF